MIAEAEVLKKKLTDKYVVVNQSIPELRRFVGLTGRVITVNMNCRALVQFDAPVDISWYDIDPAFLTVVDAPQPKAKAEPAKEPAAAKTKPSAASAPASGGKKLSPLELARQQGAAGKASAPAGEKKLSPLEQARLQGAAQGGQSAAPAKKLSPLELARQQGAAKSPGEVAEVAQPAAEAPEVEQENEAAPAVEEAVVAETAEESAPAESTNSAAAATPGSTAEIIALARQQGPFKG